MSEGDYHPDDADWNYKDVPHLAEVHGQVDAVAADMGDDAIASIALQKVLGVPLPMALTIYSATPDSQTYFASWLAWVLVVETRWAAVGELRTRVETTYAVGSHRWMRWSFPLVRWAVTRNYRILMSEDLPMRDRRGQLRRRGFPFLKPGATHSYLATTDLMKPNVVPPPGCPVPEARIELATQLPADGQLLVGEDDHLGLRVTRRGDKLLIHKRMCPHEGAALDTSPCSPEGRLRCPWHGRLFPPEAQLPVSGGEATTEHHRLRCEAGVLSVEPRRGEPA